MPVRSLAANSFFLGLFIVLAYILPHNIFIYVSSASVFITLFNWIVIIVTYLAFKKSARNKPGAGGSRNYLFKPVLALVLVLAVISSIPFVPQQIPGMVSGSALLILFWSAYYLCYRAGGR